MIDDLHTFWKRDLWIGMPPFFTGEVGGKVFSLHYVGKKKCANSYKLFSFSNGEKKLLGWYPTKDAAQSRAREVASNGAPCSIS